MLVYKTLKGEVSMTYDALLKSNIPLVTLDFIDNAMNK